MPEPITKDLVPVGDAAMQLKLSREKVIRRITCGELEGKKVRGFWYVKAASLTAAARAALR